LDSSPSLSTLTLVIHKAHFTHTLSTIKPSSFPLVNVTTNLTLLWNLNLSQNSQSH